MNTVFYYIQQDMIENVLEIKDTHVREVMTPLVDVVAIDGTATLVDFQKLWETHQYSRFSSTEFNVNLMEVNFLLHFNGFPEYLSLKSV